MKKVFITQSYFKSKIGIIVIFMANLCLIAKPFTAKIVFKDGNSIYLNDFKIGVKQSIDVYIGETSSSTTVDFDKISSIIIEPVSVYPDLKLVSKSADIPPLIKKVNNDYAVGDISGYVNMGSISFQFKSKHHMCKSIHFLQDIKISPMVPVSEKDKISCKIISTNSSSKNLSDVRFFIRKEVETGYARFGSSKIYRDIYGINHYLHLPVKNGLIGIRFVDLEYIDFFSGIVKFTNDSIMQIVKSASWPDWDFYLEPIEAISGFSNDKYYVIKAEDISKIISIKKLPGMIKSPPKTPLIATPLGKICISVSKRDIQILESVTIVTPLSKDYCIGRILMNRLKPHWHIENFHGSDMICTSDEFLNEIAIKQDKFWYTTPISKVKKISNFNNKITILLLNDESIICEEIEMDRINGDNAHDRVKYDFDDIISFERIEY